MASSSKLPAQSPTPSAQNPKIELPGLTPEQKLAVYRQIVGIPQYVADGFGPSQNAVDIEEEALQREDSSFSLPNNGKSPEGRNVSESQPLLQRQHSTVKQKKTSIFSQLISIMLPYKDPPINKGIYHHILVEEGKTTLYSYMAFIIITSLLLLQVVLAAVITSLSTWGNHRVPLIALGATSTIIASILAWLRGQGLPNRTYQYKYAMGRVRLQAELMDSKFQCRELAARLDPVEEAQHIVNMYIATKSDQQKNEPDFYSFDSELLTTKNHQDTQAIAAGNAKDDSLKDEIAGVVKLMKELVSTINREHLGSSSGAVRSSVGNTG